ncbi:MAG: hypothetical protein FJ304_13160 [Planctomycetes bacterium]|nr:hypothetical protein [Planctomycetota bacterium]
MAIEFDCPHCQHHYRLKDELAGKSATCKNCRGKIVIPNPVTIPDDAPALDAAAAEAAALAALADDPVPTAAEQAARIIDVECQYCNFKWTEPIARAGKNTVCKNPECKQRIKIPEPKDEGQYDWRQTRTKGPSLAKKNNEKLEGVVDAAADAKIVSGTALKEADATGIELDPRPLKQKVTFVLLALALVACVGFGIRYLITSSTSSKEDRLIAEAQDELVKSAESLPKDERPLFHAIIHTAAGEHALRHDGKDKLKAALEQFAKARDEYLRKSPATAARNAVGAELAVATLGLGGTDAEVSEQKRVRWTPEPNMKVRPNERVFTVYEELQKTLLVLQGADPDFRAALARRLTRELAKRGQTALAVDLIPLALFPPTEYVDAKALVALEVYRGDKGSPVPAAVADDLTGRGADAVRGAAFAQTLFSTLKTPKAPLAVAPPGGGAVLENTRMAYTALYLMEEKWDDALKLAQRAGSAPDQQLRALALCAEWSPGPNAEAALTAAFAVVSATKGRKDAVASPHLVVRFAQLAGAGGKPDLAKQFAQSLPDEGTRAWALGDSAALRIQGAPKEKASADMVEVPDDSSKVRVGHAWGRLWVARQNTKLSGDRSGELKDVNSWPTPVVPFGKAGIALGLQDKDRP